MSANDSKTRSPEPDEPTDPLALRPRFKRIAENVAPEDYGQASADEWMRTQAEAKGRFKRTLT